MAKLGEFRILTLRETPAYGKAEMGPDIDKWPRVFWVSPRTRNNLRVPVQALFAFAKTQRYLPKDHDEMEAVMVAKR